MKKALRSNGRKAIAAILTFMLVLSMTTNVFAGWATYNGSGYSSGNVYLEEKWYGSQQIIHYYSDGNLVRTVAGQANTLWIDSNPILYNLYDTCYWCFDKWGNIFAIDQSQNLLLCRLNTTRFVVNTMVTGCTGFQRDNGKIGYLVYTNNGSYSLEELLRGNNNNNGNVNNNYNNSYVETYYPYVNKSGNYYYYYTDSNRYYKYYLSGSTLYYKGTNYNSSNTKLATGVKKITFFNDEYDEYDGYIVYANSSKDVYSYPLGKTSTSYKNTVGKKFSSFAEYNYMSEGYYNTSGNYKDFSDMEDYDLEEYPYVEESGDYYYYYTSSTKYYKYYWDGSNLYYKGTNNSSSSVKLSTGVKDITFTYDGYIAYANTSNYVYAYPLGKTSSSYKESVGKYFGYFDDDDYMSEGYYDKYDDYNWFDF